MANIIQHFQSNPANINGYINKGDTPLTYAVKSHNIHEIKELIKLGADVNKKDIRGFSPLSLAALLNVNSMIKLLIECGANINDPVAYCSFTSKEYLKPTLLIREIWNYTKSLSKDKGRTSIDMMKFYIANGADVNTPMDDGTIALSHAVKLNQTEISTLLLESGSVTHIKTVEGNLESISSTNKNIQEIINVYSAQKAAIESIDMRNIKRPISISL